MKSVELSCAIKMKQKFQKSNRFQAYSRLFPQLCMRDHGDQLFLSMEFIGDKHATLLVKTELLASRSTSRCTYQIFMKTEAIWYVTLTSPFGPRNGSIWGETKQALNHRITSRTGAKPNQISLIDRIASRKRGVASALTELEWRNGRERKMPWVSWGFWLHIIASTLQRHYPLKLPLLVLYFLSPEKRSAMKRASNRQNIHTSSGKPVSGRIKG